MTFFESNSHLLKSEIATTFEDIKSFFRLLAENGCQGFECSKESLDKIKSWGRKERVFSETLEVIRTDLGDCKRCGLSKKRKNIVFGAGDPHAKLMFVGEGPGYEEDQLGEPFVGAAGRLLTKIIEAINHTREQVYICNIIKCRPPGNRNPMQDEIDVCFPFLKRQIASVKPDIICALGTFAAQTLLETKSPISRLRGSFYDYMGSKVIPTYHPAYLLRNPEKKRDVWEDMKRLMKAMDSNR